eukprot:2816539-Amphidinium_carterae.2
MSFGATASFHRFNRVARSLRTSGTELMYLNWSSYFDDFCLIEFAPLAQAADDGASLLFESLGWLVATDKVRPFLPRFELLGVGGCL